MDRKPSVQLNRLCRSMLALVDAIPSAVQVHIIPTDYPRLIFIADQREEIETLEMEATAGQYGDVVVSECFHSRRDAKPLIGCIVEIPADKDADDTAGKLRAAYHIATDPTADDDEQGPF